MGDGSAIFCGSPTLGTRPCESATSSPGSCAVAGLFFVRL